MWFCRPRLSFGRLGFEKLRICVGIQILHYALRDENERDDETDRQQNPKERTREIDPEIADGLGFATRDAADESDGERDADCSGREVVICEAGHLREIAHRRFGNVRLPVRVCGERSGGVPGEIGGDVGEFLRIESEHVLLAR